MSLNQSSYDFTSKKQQKYLLNMNPIVKSSINNSDNKGSSNRILRYNLTKNVDCQETQTNKTNSKTSNLYTPKQPNTLANRKLVSNASKEKTEIMERKKIMLIILTVRQNLKLKK